MEGKSKGGNGIGFFGLLTILFIALKLTGIIGWSWLWVLSPIWISVSLSLIILAVFGLFLLTMKSRRVKKK